MSVQGKELERRLGGGFARWLDGRRNLLAGDILLPGVLRSLEGQGEEAHPG